METLILFATYLASFVLAGHLAAFAQRVRSWGDFKSAWAFNRNIVLNERVVLSALWLVAAVMA